MSGHNNIEHLVTMANQIGDFFAPMKDHSKSQEEIIAHLKRTWDPRMRKALVEHVQDHNGEGLNQVVLDAVRTHTMV